MINQFNPNNYEAKLRKQWDDNKIYSVDHPLVKDRKKYYCLDMFPYPSGEGLHVGHWRGYVLSDVWARFMLLKGFNVLHPMGWDNFGLPAENDAIKRKIHPRVSTAKNITNMRRQLKEMGCIYDWDKEIDTTEEGYYKWTQWIFLKMYEKGLAYQKEQPVNWCNTCRVVLANEEVAGGMCERCNGTNIERRNIRQWMLKITEYAEKLLTDLDGLNWPEKVKEMQRNWIGKSTGANVVFELDGRCEMGDGSHKVTVYTTRPDTLYGATFMVLAPEHPLVEQIINNTTHLPSPISHLPSLKDYVQTAKFKSNLDRQISKEKTGVFTGVYAINPVNGAKVPVWVADYVLMDYGTGAIMAVPAHDERDFEFAKKFNIPIIEVISSANAQKDKDGNLTAAHIDNGVLINSPLINGLDVTAAKDKITAFLERDGKGKAVTNYKLRDWIFARQRYWGEPIPFVYCNTCGLVPVPYSQLPITLPDVENYTPSEDGSSPLSKITHWVNTTCPTCGGAATRETDTMPQWAGSCWYYIRYADNKNDLALASPKAIADWLPVDMYVGGIEHAVLHLLYSRFWTKFLADIDVLPFNEPFKELFTQGMILRKAHRCDKCNRWVYDNEIDLSLKEEDRLCPTCGDKLQISVEKMSKSKGNVVSPDGLIEKYGTDSLRLYELFVGDPALDTEWNDAGLKACYNLLAKIWNWVTDVRCEMGDGSRSSANAYYLLNKLIKEVKTRVFNFKLNTAVSAFMEFINAASKPDVKFSLNDIKKVIILLSPFAPHFAEEVWQNHLNQTSNVAHQTLPEEDETVLVQQTIDFPVQINGKFKLTITAPSASTADELTALLYADERFVKAVNAQQPKKVIFVPQRLINIII
jgi:leucyl-tRNA synthetase